MGVGAEFLNFKGGLDFRGGATTFSRCRGGADNILVVYIIFVLPAHLDIRFLKIFACGGLLLPLVYNFYKIFACGGLILPLNISDFQKIFACGNLFSPLTLQF